MMILKNFIKDKRGFPTMMISIFLLLLFGAIMVFSLLYTQLSINQTIISNICKEAVSKIQWVNVESEQGKSTNQTDSRHIGTKASGNSPNKAVFDENQAVNTIQDTFTRHNMETRNVTAHLDGYNLIIDGEVKLKVHNSLTPNQVNTEHWQKFEYVSRLYKNYQKQ
jgi:hypothetical protein